MKKDEWKAKLLIGFFAMLDLLFPPVCAGCGKPGARWCKDCQRRVQTIKEPLCDICGLPQVNTGVCKVCSQTRPVYKILRSWAIFEDPIQRALHRLKYHRDRGLGEALARQMTPFIKDLNWSFDAIVPIPLGFKRLKERGYNQVAMLAMPLSLFLEVEYFPKALTRIRETRSQVGLNILQRHDNVKDAFQASFQVRGRNLLLIDDVSTTGSTLASAAGALYAAGADNVNAVTLARALPHHHYSVV